MATGTSKPEIGDVVRYDFRAYDKVLIGTVIDLLSSQFTIRIQEPESFKDKTHFIFYAEDWTTVSDAGSILDDT